MVEHVYKSIQFGLIIFVGVVSFLFWVMVRPTCSDCDPTRVLGADDSKFPA